MYQNAQLEELLTPHREHLNNVDILLEKYGYSAAPEGIPGGITTTIKIQLMPHDGITSYLTTTSTELEDKKYPKQRLNRKQ